MSIKSRHGQNYTEKKTRYGWFHTYDEFNLDGFPRKLKILLPLDYKESTHHYPVVYMNDGNTAFNAEGLSPWSWNVHKSTSSLIKNGAIEPIIIAAVYPLDRNYEYLTVKRYHEWTGEVVHGGGGLKDYAQYLAHSLKPFIDQSYRTNHLKEKTAIVGSSFGGLASLYIAASHGDVFGMAGVFSPAFFEILNQSFRIQNNGYLRTVIKNIKAASVKPRLWIDWGEDEGLDEPEVSELSRRIVRIFKRELGYRTGQDLIYFKDSNGTHDERAWDYRFRIMLEVFYGIGNT
ncbi:MAG TPA: alpha/beta hydrolase [Lentisphaeria bacterium]|nr:MAG: hypothetical protein A2X47_05855 [Lentisphaerae bacterium GWF2_38_69]HBM14945.1 alpha/beta hydrolase [Lentisphaeria bacterium]